MRIRKDIVENFNNQIDKMMRAEQRELNKFRSIGFFNSLESCRRKLSELQSLKNIFNHFSETGELKIP